jgi:superfamily II DNA or RNA helicase
MQPPLFDAPAPQGAPQLHVPLPATDAVLLALAVGAGARTRTWLGAYLPALGEPNAQGKRYSGTDVAAALSELARQGQVSEDPMRRSTWALAPELIAPALARALTRHPGTALAEALARCDGYGHPVDPGGRWSFHTAADAVALLRLLACAGLPLAQLLLYKTHCGWGVEWDDVLWQALQFDVDETLFARMHPSVQVHLLGDGLSIRCAQWRPTGSLPLEMLAERLFADAAHQTAVAAAIDASHLRWHWAYWLALAGRTDEVEPVIAPLTQPSPMHSPAEAAHWDILANVLEAFRLARLGQWRDSVALYEQALAERRSGTGERKGLLPLMLGTAYVQALMALGEPAGLRGALKFCLAESGKRQPSSGSAWGLMALALQMRLGESRRDPKPFSPASRAPYVDPLDYWRWLMRAWLGETGEPTPQLPPVARAAWKVLRDGCAGAGLADLAAQLDAALEVIEGRPAPPGFFAAGRAERWRDTLAALAAVAQPEAAVASRTQASVQATRLIWVLDVNDFGALRDIGVSEQKQGARGWSKPRASPLSRLAKAEGLPAHDAAVARCIRQSSYDRSWQIDLAAAAVALVGHPVLEFADTPGAPVTLTEGAPALEVADLGEQLRLRLQPPPRWADPLAAAAEPQRWSGSAAEQKELEALADLTVVRDTPQSARLLRLNPAQKRAAQLIGAGLSLPKAAADQLEPVLRSLGAHFQVHADELQAGREVAAEARLRAELSPQGDGVHLRLVVAPVGTEGPRLTPGQGRAHLIAKVGGEIVGAQRDLTAERSHLEAVLDACPMLAEPPENAPTAWDIETPDATLALLERLHTLNAVAALDWPQGKPIRVDSAGLGALQVRVESGHEWLALAGGVTVNEQLVAHLGRLLDWAATQKSRFMPLGEGRYLALTEELKARLDELATVAERDRGERSDGEGARVTPLAAAWLERTLAGADVAADDAFRARIERLAAAQADRHHLPGTLQASLRPYQEEGYEWAMRLAESGFGACLADDMGLGKTLQALAVLLARSAGGPALVVAPTSLIGNWQAEARRFAPSLRVQVYAEGDETGDRDALITQAGPGDVLLVSYQLQLFNAAAFAARGWHTLVLDEAQAIKNAAAKRSQAAFELNADFRLALSGTPIENRLAELWSIMRVCNPGLLGSLPRFNLRFAVPIERDRHRGAQRTLRRLIGPFILRRTKAEVLDDLPPRTELTLLVQGDATEQAHYEALRRQALIEAKEALSGGNPGQAHLNILAQLTRLRRAACDPRLVTPDLAQPGAKVQAFGELAAELVANGHKALVFSQFVDFLALLKAPLEAAGIRYQYLDGSTPAAERTARVAAFQAGEGELFLISLKAGGFGLNLTVADYVVIADPWWNPAAEDQASGRAHRIGQQRPVTVYRLVHQGTLEEKIVELHADKRELADSVLEGQDRGSALPADALLALLQDER